MALIEVTIVNGGVISIDEKDIIYVTSQDSGAKIQYLNKGSLKQVVVSETPSSIDAVGDSLVSINIPDSLPLIIEVGKVKTLSGTTQAEIVYSDGGSSPSVIVSSDDYSTVKTLFDGKNPLGLNPEFYWETTDQDLGPLNSFLDKTGAYTLTGTPSVSIVDDVGVTPSIRAASMVSTNYYKLPLSLSSFVAQDHTLVMCIRPNLSIPLTFTTHFGAFVNAGPSEMQYGIQVTTVGELQCLIRETGVLKYGRTELVGMGNSEYTVVTVRVSQAGGIVIRTNGVNRTLMPPGPGDGDLTGITLSNLNITKELFWGARNNDGTAGSFATANYCSLIGYNSILTDQQIDEYIESFYAS